MESGQTKVAKQSVQNYVCAFGNKQGNKTDKKSKREVKREM
jgi:hypothetical protein